MSFGHVARSEHGTRDKEWPSDDFETKREEKTIRTEKIESYPKATHSSSLVLTRQGGRGGRDTPIREEDEDPKIRLLRNTF